MQAPQLVIVALAAHLVACGGSGVEKPPAAPAGVTAYAGDTQIFLSWSPVPGPLWHNVYWSTSATITPATGNRATAGMSTSYVQSGLANGTTYYFVVTAATQAGESLPSLVVNATPTASPPVSGSLRVIAGLPTSPGFRDGTGTAASFFFPRDVAVDASGNVYVAESYTIRRITPAGVVSTLAGAALEYGSADGLGADARFYDASGVAVDGSGTVYVADRHAGTIRRITPAGLVTTLAGAAGLHGSADGTGAAARFFSPSGVAVDGSGSVYVADTSNHTIREITSDGVVSTLAGAAGESGSADGAGASARFHLPSDVAVDSNGNVYVADAGNKSIRKISPAGVVSTLAGTAGAWGSADGTGAAARFSYPSGMSVDGTGNVYVADAGNESIRKISPAGIVSTLAGKSGAYGSSDGTGAAARFYDPCGVAVDGSGMVYVADRENYVIRKITPAGVVSTLAGTARVLGSADGAGAAARFFNPLGVAVDGSGNRYVADTYNSTIRKITPDGVVSTLAGTAGAPGSADGTGAAARFYDPYGVAVDVAGNVYVADTHNSTIRKITPTGVVSTLAGTAGKYGSTDGTGAAARFDSPASVAVDGSGNVYVADTYNSTIRKITPEGAVSTLAGSADRGGAIDGIGAAAEFQSPSAVAVDGSGNVYVADGDSTIRMISPDGVVSTLAGTPGRYGSADGLAYTAEFNGPSGLAVDGSGNVYVADTKNYAIRKITPAGLTTTPVGVPGLLSTVPGPLPASLYLPFGVAVDPRTGNLLVTVRDAVLEVVFDR